MYLKKDSPRTELVSVIYHISKWSKENNAIDGLCVICEMSKSQATGLWIWSPEKELDTTRLKHHEVNFQVTCEGHQITLKYHLS